MLQQINDHDFRLSIGFLSQCGLKIKENHDNFTIGTMISNYDAYSNQAVIHELEQLLLKRWRKMGKIENT